MQSSSKCFQDFKYLLRLAVFLMIKMELPLQRCKSCPQPFILEKIQMVRFAEELNTKHEKKTGVRRGQSFWPLPNGMNRFTVC